MREREIIEKELGELSVRVDIGAGTQCIVEVLLDIRELLNNK